MTFEKGLSLWTTRDDEETAITPTRDDKFFQAGGYLFCIRPCGNIVLRKIEKSKFTLYEAFRCLRFYLIKNKIQYIRIEGTPRRYNYISKMFPMMSFYKDKMFENRNIFYAKVY